MPKYKDEAFALTRQLEEQRGKIYSHRDPNLTDEGLAKKRSEATAALREAATAQAQDIKTRAEARAFMARLGADTKRPKVPETPVGLMRTEQKWNQAKQLLENGRDIRTVIRNADVDTLLAIEEFAPTYLQSKTAPKNGIHDVMAGAVDEAPDLTAAIEARLIEISPADVAEALSEAQAAEQDLATAAPYIEYVTEFGSRGASSKSLVDLAIESAYAGNPAPAEEPAGDHSEPAVA